MVGLLTSTLERMDAAVYARISHVDDPDNTLGVDRQEADGRALVERKGWNLAAVHVDNNRSAWRRNRKRPGWDALLEDIREHRVDVVVVAHPDRLIRQPRDLEDLLDLARDTGVKLVSAGGNRDLSNPDDVFILRIEVAHACRSSDDTSRRVSRGHLAAAEAGRPGGGTGRHRAYGYEPDQLTVVAHEQAIVREVAERVVAGETWGAVIADLNARQVPTVSGAPWSRTSITKTVTSLRTAGRRSYRGQDLGPAVWPPLIPHDLWQAVRSFRGPTHPGQTNRRKYLLSGLARCECDGLIISRTGDPPGYACPDCHMRAARHHIDLMVHARLHEDLNKPEVMAALTMTDAPENAEDSVIVAEGQARIGKILDEWDQEGLAGDWARGKIRQIERDVEAAQRRMAARARRTSLAQLAGIDLDDLTSRPLDVRRELVRTFLPGIVIKRTTIRGNRFDYSRVLLDGPQPVT